MSIQEMVNSLNKNGSNFIFCIRIKGLIDKNNEKEAISCFQKHFNCSEDIANDVFIEFKKQIYSEFKKIESETGVSVTLE